MHSTLDTHYARPDPETCSKTCKLCWCDACQRKWKKIFCLKSICQIVEETIPGHGQSDAFKSSETDDTFLWAVNRVQKSIEKRGVPDTTDEIRSYLGSIRNFLSVDRFRAKDRDRKRREGLVYPDDEAENMRWEQFVSPPLRPLEEPGLIKQLSIYKDEVGVCVSFLPPRLQMVMIFWMYKRRILNEVADELVWTILIKHNENLTDQLKEEIRNDRSKLTTKVQAQIAGVCVRTAYKRQREFRDHILPTLENTFSQK